MDKVAIIIGHNAIDKGGISPVLGNEFDYWRKVAGTIKKKIPDLVDIYERKHTGSYSREMQAVLDKVNSKEYRYILELHFNCANRIAKGSEFICYWSNERAKYLGKEFCNLINAEYEVDMRRKWSGGAILAKTSKTRGGYGICHSRGTYILLEPFFGDNIKEAKKFEDIEKVAQTFAEFIEEVE